MRGNNVMGIIFSNIHDESLRELTDGRTMGSVPFGSRYRLIDFPLSNMVNSGINKVGVITKHNYQSLMDHLGSGKAWDLSRKRDGLFILPPFGNSRFEFNNRLETLMAISGFLSNSKEEYILLSDCDVICNIDYQKVIDSHIQKNADITLIYKRGVLPKIFKKSIVLSLNTKNRVTDLSIDSKIEGDCSYSLNMFLMKRKLLLDLIINSANKNKTDFKRDILKQNINTQKIFGYEFRGYSYIMTSINAYFEANMNLRNKNVRKQLFDNDRPIYTKVRDDMPGKYGVNSLVKDCIVANGCIVDGEVDNSILFRGVKISKGTKISNSIILQDTVIKENCNLNYVICDKDVKIKPERTLTGFQSYPVYISKSSII